MFPVVSISLFLIRFYLVFCVQYTNLRLTNMHGIQSRKQNDEESSRVFRRVDQMGIGQLGIAVTSQTLSKTEPGGESGQDGTDGVAVGHTLVRMAGNPTTQPGNLKCVKADEVFDV